MANHDQRSAREFDVDVENLYREETFTDLGAASVRRLTPVKPDGADDAARDVLYLGETQIMTQMGPLPLQFPLDGPLLTDAFKSFPAAVKTAVEKLNERAREAMREEASRSVVPGAVPPGMGGSMPGVGPGGKIMFDK